jgi:glycosyltransferase involved in cell wall biosynthesis
MNSDIDSNSMEFSIVIPILNEQDNIPVLHNRLTSVMQGLGKDYEIIYVDDGSSDNSYQLLVDLHGKDNHIKIIRLTRNFGQHPAILAGFKITKGRTVITIDADLQNPPEEIPKLIDKLNEGYDIVFGVFMKRKHNLFRRAGSQFAKWVLTRVIPVETTSLSGFRALRSYTVDHLKLLNETSKFLDALLCWMGYRVGTVEVAHDERLSGKTKYTPLKLISLWLDMVISFTDVPLRIAMLLGTVFGIIGLLMAIVYFICFFVYRFTVPGFTTTIILITIFAGVQLLCLGIIGEYIGRMNIQTKKRPDYIIREKKGCE